MAGFACIDIRWSVGCHWISQSKCQRQLGFLNGELDDEPLTAYMIAESPLLKHLPLPALSNFHSILFTGGLSTHRIAHSGLLFQFPA